MSIPMECNFTPATCGELTDARLGIENAQTRLDNLEEWQKAQNGHLKGIDERLDKFLWFLVGISVSSTGALTLLIIQKIAK